MELPKRLFNTPETPKAKESKNESKDNPELKEQAQSPLEKKIAMVSKSDSKIRELSKLPTLNEQQRKELKTHLSLFKFGTKNDWSTDFDIEDFKKNLEQKILKKDDVVSTVQQSSVVGEKGAEHGNEYKITSPEKNYEEYSHATENPDIDDSIDKLGEEITKFSSSVDEYIDLDTSIEKKRRTRDLEHEIKKEELSQKLESLMNPDIKDESTDSSGEKSALGGITEDEVDKLIEDGLNEDSSPKDIDREQEKELPTAKEVAMRKAEDMLAEDKSDPEKVEETEPLEDVLASKRRALAFEYSKLREKVAGVLGGREYERVKDGEEAHRIALIENEYRESLREYRKELLEENPNNAEEVILKTVVEEATAFYDLKTDFRLEEKNVKIPEKMLLQVKKIAEGYTRMPKKYKWAIAGALGIMSGGVTAGMSTGFISASAGASMLEGVGFVLWGRGLLSSAAVAIGVETVMKGRQENKEKKEISEKTREFESIRGEHTVEYLGLVNTQLDKKLFDLEGAKKAKKYGRFALAGTAGALMFSGVVGKAFGKVLGFGGDAAKELIDPNKGAFGDRIEYVKDWFSSFGDETSDVSDTAVEDVETPETPLAVDGGDNGFEDASSVRATEQETSGSNYDTERRDPFMQSKEVLTDNTILKKGEGVEHVLRRQLEANPEKFGYTGDVNDHTEVDKWTGVEAHKLAINNGFVDKNTGEEIRTYYDTKNPTHYVLKESGFIDRINSNEYSYPGESLQNVDSVGVDKQVTDTENTTQTPTKKDLSEYGINKKSQEWVNVPGENDLRESIVDEVADVNKNNLEKFGIRNGADEMVNIPGDDDVLERNTEHMVDSVNQEAPQEKDGRMNSGWMDRLLGNSPGYKRGLELAEKMGIETKDGISVHSKGGVPIEIDGKPVPIEFLTDKEIDMVKAIDRYKDSVNRFNNKK